MDNNTRPKGDKNGGELAMLGAVLTIAVPIAFLVVSTQAPVNFRTI